VSDKLSYDHWLQGFNLSQEGFYDGHAFTPYPYSTGEAWCKWCGLTEDKHDRPKPLMKGSQG
jgi:hypothetical protein